MIAQGKSPPGWVVVVILVTVWVLLAWRIFHVWRSRRNQKPPEPPNYPHLVTAKIYDPVQPLERGEKYEDPLFDSLEERGVGRVSGGGTQIDKAGKIEWIELELQLADLDGTVEFVARRLRELGAPPGSVLEFQRGEENVTVPIA
jgi:hypothetical protein